MRWQRCFALGLAGLLGACSLLPPRHPPASLHDFGPPPAGDSTAPPCGLSLRVEAPDWLNDGSIQYRYETQTRLSAYRDNRWIAPPSALLEERIRTLLSEPGARLPACRLNVTLTAFEQRFLPDGGATALITARLQMTEPGSGKRLAGIDITHRTPSTSPDVQGGVAALAQAANAMAEQIVAWLGSTWPALESRPADQRAR